MGKLTDIEILAKMSQEELASNKYDPVTVLPVAEAYLDDWRSHGDVQPTLLRLSRILKVDQDTVTNWKKSFPQFARVCNDITCERALVLSNMGLTGDFKEGITKMQLAHCETNSWINQSKVDNVSSDGTMSPTTTPEALAEAVIKRLELKHEN
jgi:hypothetical protein